MNENFKSSTSPVKQIQWNQDIDDRLVSSHLPLSLLQSVPFLASFENCHDELPISENVTNIHMVEGMGLGRESEAMCGFLHRHISVGLGWYGKLQYPTAYIRETAQQFPLPDRHTVATWLVCELHLHERFLEIVIHYEMNAQRRGSKRVSDGWFEEEGSRPIYIFDHWHSPRRNE